MPICRHFHFWPNICYHHNSQRCRFYIKSMKLWRLGKFRVILATFLLHMHKSWTESYLWASVHNSATTVLFVNQNFLEEIYISSTHLHFLLFLTILDTSMSLLFIFGPKCSLAASHPDLWWVTVSMLTGQTDRRTNGMTPDHYVTLSAWRGHRKNTNRRSSLERAGYVHLPWRRTKEKSVCS